VLGGTGVARRDSGYGRRGECRQYESVDTLLICWVGLIRCGIAPCQRSYVYGVNR